MHHEVSTPSAARAGGARSRFGRILSGAFVVLSVGTLAYYALPRGAGTDLGEPGIASVTLNPSTPTASTASPPVAPAGAPRFRRTDEPAYTDATNPHGG